MGLDDGCDSLSALALKDDLPFLKFLTLLAGEPSSKELSISRWSPGPISQLQVYTIEPGTIREGSGGISRSLRYRRHFYVGRPDPASFW